MGDVFRRFEGNAENIDFAVTHNEATITKINGKGFIEGIGTAKTDLSSKHGLGIVKGNTAKAADGSSKFSVHPSHAKACANIGSEAVVIGDIPVHIGKQSLNANIGFKRTLIA